MCTQDLSGTRTFTFYSDPGHGWLAVPRALLRSLGVEEDISHCSYQRDGMCYLEEDCDAGVFITAARDVGLTVTFREKVARTRRSRIRGYEPYQPGR